MRLNLECVKLKWKRDLSSPHEYVNITAESNFRYIIQTGTKRTPSKI